jgi:hypothetical protein
MIPWSHFTNFVSHTDWLSLIKQIIRLLNKLQGLLIVIFTGLLVLYNRLLSRDTNLLRTRETEPKLEIFLAPVEGATIFVNIVIRNIGGGAARDIEWNIDADAVDLVRHDIHFHEINLFKSHHYFPSEEKIVCFFGSGPQILAEPKLKPIQIHVTYKNERLQNPQKDSFLIDPEPLRGILTIGTPPIFQIAESLSKISDKLGNLVAVLEKPLVRTIPEAEYQAEESKSEAEYRARMLQRTGARPQRARSQSGAERPPSLIWKTLGVLGVLWKKVANVKSTK